MKRAPLFTAVAMVLGIAGSVWSASSDDSLTDKARQFLALAKARLEAEREQETLERSAKQRGAQGAQREDALQAAIEVSRQKSKELAGRERESERQLRQARDEQIRNVYNRGVALFRQGKYDEAIAALQQIAGLDPAHPLNRTVDSLIAKAEVRRFELQARAKAAVPGHAPGAQVPDLERLLAQKRVEHETLLKHARQAIHQEQFDTAIELGYRVLSQDPNNRAAERLIHHARVGKVNAEEERLEDQVLLDEEKMMNEVIRSQLLAAPAEARGGAGSTRPLRPGGQAVSALLSQPISFDFQDVALGDVLDFVTDAAAISIVPSPQLDLKGKLVTLRVEQMPLNLALKALVKNQGLAYRIEDGVVLIAPPEEFANQRVQTRVFSLQSGLGPFALQTSAVQTNPSLELTSLKALIEQVVPQPAGSKLVVDERSGSLIVTNTDENLQRIQSLLDQLDIAPVQVLIESRFVELNVTDLEHFAIESVLTGDFDLTKKTAPNDTRGPGHQIASGGGVKFPSIARESEALNVTLQGVLTGAQFESVLHLLEETQKSKTLSAPRITALNNQPATIKVVDEFRYPTRYEVSLVQFDVNGDGDFDDAGETEFVNVPQDFQKRDIGILLNVTPSVGKDHKTITLVLAPEVSQFSSFRDLGGGVTVPEFTSSQLTTSVVIENGQTVVLGGLMKDAISETKTKVPVFGDIPLVGHLFRQNSSSQTKKNLLIFVTGKILEPKGPTI